MSDQIAIMIITQPLDLSDNANIWRKRGIN